MTGNLLTRSVLAGRRHASEIFDTFLAFARTIAKRPIDANPPSPFLGAPFRRHLRVHAWQLRAHGDVAARIV